MKTALKKSTESPFAKLRLKKTRGLSVHDQLVTAVSEAIRAKRLRRDDRVPSVREAAEELGLSPNTVAKAYRELKQRGLIDAGARRGYFVVSETSDSLERVFLLTSDPNPYKNIFYRRLHERLGGRAGIDVYYHHSNPDVFQMLIQRAVGKYHHYVISPFPHPRLRQALNVLSREQVVIFDRCDTVETGRFRFATQDFSEALLRCLDELLSLIKKYEDFVLVLPHEEDPQEILSAFGNFVKRRRIRSSTQTRLTSREIKPGRAYLVIHDEDMIEVIRECRARGWKLGRDVGLIVGSSRVDLQACKLEYSIVSPK